MTRGARPAVVARTGNGCRVSAAGTGAGAAATAPWREAVVPVAPAETRSGGNRRRAFR